MKCKIGLARSELHEARLKICLKTLSTNVSGICLTWIPSKTLETEGNDVSFNPVISFVQSSNIQSSEVQVCLNYSKY